MKKLYILLLLCSLGQAWGQKSLSCDEVLINRTKGTVSFYIQKKMGTYKEVSLTFPMAEGYKRGEIFKAFTPTWEKEKESISHDAIYSPTEDNVIRLEDIRPASLEEFLGKKYYLYKNEEEAVFFSFISPYTAQITKLKYRKSWPLGEYVSYPDDSEKKWRIEEIQHYALFVLDMGHQKKIYGLIGLNTSEDVHLLVPLKDQTRFLNYHPYYSPYSNRFFFSTSLEENPENRPADLRNNFHHFHLYAYYHAIPCEDSKKMLINRLGDAVLEKNYDSIRIERHFIIAKDGKQTDIYNAFLEKLNLGDAKGAYLVHGNDILQVLNEKGIHYYNPIGEEVAPNDFHSYVPCGTPSIGRFECEYKLLKGKNCFSLEEALYPIGYNVKREVKKKTTYYLKGTLPSDKLSILDTHEGSLYIKVERNQKEGLYEYKIPNIGDRWILERSDGNYDAYELIAPIFDKIDENDYFLFYKNGKVGLYPQKEASYDKLIYERYGNFYRFKKGKKEGYLDAHTVEEFYE